MIFIIPAHVCSYEYSWNFTLVDSDGDSGKYCSLSYNPLTGYPGISYMESGSSSLRFAWYNGSIWNKNALISDNSLYSSLAFNSSGNPCIVFFSELPFKEVRFIKALNTEWGNSESWNESLVGSLGIKTSFPSLVFNNSDIPLISYTGPGEELFFAYANDESWHGEEVWGSDCKVYTSAAVNPVSGLPAIAYLRGAPDGRLRFTEFDGTSWKFPVTPHNSDGYGLSCSLAFNSSGYPGISYIQKTTGILWYAWYDGISWKKTCVDGTVGKYSAVPYTKLAYNKSGCPGISYYDGRNGLPGDLKFAFCDLNNPSAWQKEIVYSESDSGLYNALSFDPATDLPVVAFYREDAGDLYFGIKGAKPEADFSSSVSYNDENMTVLFSDSTSSQSPVTGWHWNFGDGYESYTGTPPIHEYPTSGTYPVTLNVSNIFGTSEITKNIDVNTYSDFAAVNVSGFAPLCVNFTDKSRGEPLFWNWSFGDGEFLNTTIISQKNASHIYESAGNYTVSLLTGRNGLINTTTRGNMVTVYSNPSEQYPAAQNTGGSLSHSGNSGNTKTSTGSAYNIKAGETVTFEMDKGAVKMLSAIFSDDTPKAMFTVERMSERGDLFRPPNLPVYEYGEIRVYWATQSSVMASAVSFDVSRRWLEENSLSKDGVGFLLYNTDTESWIHTSVIYDGENSGFHSYSAEIPFYSYFAITSEGGAEQIDKDSIKPDLKTQIPSESYLTQTVPKSPENSEEGSGFEKIFEPDYIIASFAAFLSLAVVRIRCRK
ncbi:MAG: PGF-pre-PGF domain-containing protein [Methanomicrobiaceae archaeon]|nr:PGF-pre-PGF domain-containing protein [Methanomicrobiaceae archaeon]